MRLSSFRVRRVPMGTRSRSMYSTLGVKNGPSPNARSFSERFFMFLFGRPRCPISAFLQDVAASPKEAISFGVIVSSRSRPHETLGIPAQTRENPIQSINPFRAGKGAWSPQGCQVTTQFDSRGNQLVRRWDREPRQGGRGAPDSPSTTTHYLIEGDIAPTDQGRSRSEAGLEVAARLVRRAAMRAHRANE